MRYGNIPNTDLNASALCLGTGPFGTAVSEQDAFALLDAFVDLGGNFIDSANVYGDWIPDTKSLSEKTIGKWLAGRKSKRDQMIIATKGGHPRLASMHIPRVTREDIVHDIEQSLGHLQTDHIDLYWLHRDDPEQPIAGIMDVLNEQIRKGTIRYIGCSNWTLQRLQDANQYASEQGLQGFVGNQMMWSLALANKGNTGDQSMLMMLESEIAFHRKTKLAAIPYSSQARGFFSGRYRKDEVPTNPHVYKVYFNNENFKRLDRVTEIAAKLGKSQTEIALGYLLSHDFPVFPIIGPRTLTQLSESCLAGDIRLEPDIVDYLRIGSGWGLI